MGGYFLRSLRPLRMAWIEQTRRKSNQAKYRGNEAIESPGHAQAPAEPPCSKHRDDERTAARANRSFRLKRRVHGILFRFRHWRYCCFGARMRRTNVRPICSRRVISDLLTPTRCSLRISAA